jgi:hypothetical protein
MNNARVTLAAFVLTFLLQQCGQITAYEEEYDVAVLAFIEHFSVDDSVTQHSISVALKGTFGESTAFQFDRINVARSDTLFRIGVWGREAYKTGVVYPFKHVGIDTVLILSSPLKGLHYIDVIAAQGVLRDSTTVY